VHWGVSVLNFAIFLGIIIYFAGGKIQGFFKNRRDDLLADLTEAKKLRKQAQEKLDEYSRRLDALDEERDALLDDYRTQGEREKERLIADAKRQVEKMRSDAELVIQQEVRKAVASIEQQAVDLAVDMARKSLDEKLDPRTQNVLVDQYVDDLKSLEG
jgi:F-type H+-transporting ATPase subunit b